MNKQTITERLKATKVAQKRKERVIRWNVETSHGKIFCDNYPLSDDDIDTQLPQTYTYEGVSYPVSLKDDISMNRHYKPMTDKQRVDNDSLREDDMFSVSRNAPDEPGGDLLANPKKVGKPITTNDKSSRTNGGGIDERPNDAKQKQKPKPKDTTTKQESMF